MRHQISSAGVTLRSRQYGFDPELPEERRRRVLTIVPVDWAAEWLRPVTPDYKLVGPVLPGPGEPLPAHLEVRVRASSWMLVISQALGLTACMRQNLGVVPHPTQSCEAGRLCAAPCQLFVTQFWRLVTSCVMGFLGRRKRICDWCC